MLCVSLNASTDKQTHTHAITHTHTHTYTYIYLYAGGDVTTAAYNMDDKADVPDHVRISGSSNEMYMKRKIGLLGAVGMVLGCIIGRL